LTFGKNNNKSASQQVFAFLFFLNIIIFLAHLAAFSASGIYLVFILWPTPLFRCYSSVIYKYNNCKMKRKRHAVFLALDLDLDLLLPTYFLYICMYIFFMLFFWSLWWTVFFRWANLVSAGPALKKKKKKNIQQTWNTFWFYDPDTHTHHNNNNKME